jgi:hypothetical protein
MSRSTDKKQFSVVPHSTDKQPPTTTMDKKDSAMDRVLRTPELLEHILLYLDQESLLRTLQVNKYFCDLIICGKPLRRALWLDAFGDGKEPPLVETDKGFVLAINPILNAHMREIGISHISHNTAMHINRSMISITFKSFNDLQHTGSSYEGMLLLQHTKATQGRDMFWMMRVDAGEDSSNSAQQKMKLFSGEPTTVWKVKEAMLKMSAGGTAEDEAGGAGGTTAAERDRYEGSGQALVPRDFTQPARTRNAASWRA